VKLHLVVETIGQRVDIRVLGLGYKVLGLESRVQS
jgi:hypothetical protein